MATIEAAAAQLSAEFPGREQQIQALLTLYSTSIDFPILPPALVVHGPEGTGKTTIVGRVMEAVERCQSTDCRRVHVVVDCRRCVTGRQMMEEAVRGVAKRVGVTVGKVKCDSVLAFSTELADVVGRPDGRLEVVLVLDGIDRQRDGPTTLIPALVRIGGPVGDASVGIVMVVRTPIVSSLHASGVAHVGFPAYGRSEIISILNLRPLSIYSRAELDEMDGQVDGSGRANAYSSTDAREDAAWLWSRFVPVVWDSVGKAVCGDLVTFRRTCRSIWPKFVEPVREEVYGTRDFARLVVANRLLFSADDYAVRSSAVIDQLTHAGKWDESSEQLSVIAKFVLCGAFLASYNPARTDMTFFALTTDGTRRRRRVRTTESKTGRGTKSKRGGSMATVATARNIPRTLLHPATFPLDRMMAICKSLMDSHWDGLDQPVCSTVPSGSEVLTVIATLTTVKLLLRMSSGGTVTVDGQSVGRTTGSGDLVDPGARWRVNFGWEYVGALGRSIGVEMRDYLADEV